MILTPLGHTEFLLDVTNNDGQNVRILIDTWLSDYAVGDLMERTTKLRLDHDKLHTLDAIYISHAHCDHFDPYTLVEIYNYASPVLILPFTLRYLENTLKTFLPEVEIHWLTPGKSYNLKGIEFSGYMWPNPVITNEDDVMMIGISSERELLFAEIDTVTDIEDEGVQKSLYKVFTRRDYETACYVASRNCLEGQIPYYDVAEGKRKSFRDQYIASQKEEIAFQYERFEYEEFAHHPNIFALPGFVRGFIGQGIAYPSRISEELYSLALFPLDELVSIESDYAKNVGYSFPQKALLPGRQYKIENGGIEAGRKECPIGELEKMPLSVISTETNEVSGAEKSAWKNDWQIPRSTRDDRNERLFASGPLIPRVLNESEIEEGKMRILEILNTRFLPYWSASPVASLRDALIKNGGVYHIQFKGGARGGTPPNLPYEEKNPEATIFEYSTSRASFIEIPYEEKMHVDEEYWLLDLLDFLDGRLEMYSSFWHALDPKKVYRLWTCLGANWMNHDLVEKKYRYHFERAKNGETATEFVEKILKDL